MKKTILVVRHPRSGTINTLVLDEAIQVNTAMRNASSCISQINCSAVSDLLTSKIDSFTTSEVDFCINPYGAGNSGGTPRRNIRILENARNASSVQLLELEGSGNRCL